MIYRKSRFGHRKGFGHFGNVPGVSGGYRGTIRRGLSTQRASWAMGGVKPALSGLAKPPTKAHVAAGGKTQRWKGGKCFQVERRNPTPNRIGVGLLHLQFRPALEGLRLPPPLPPSYILEDLEGRANPNCHVLPLLHLDRFLL